MSQKHWRKTHFDEPPLIRTTTSSGLPRASTIMEGTTQPRRKTTAKPMGGGRSVGMKLAEERSQSPQSSRPTRSWPPLQLVLIISVVITVISVGISVRSPIRVRAYRRRQMRRRCEAFMVFFMWFCARVGGQSASRWSECKGFGFLCVSFVWIVTSGFWKSGVFWVGEFFRGKFEMSYSI